MSKTPQQNILDGTTTNLDDAAAQAKYEDLKTRADEMLALLWQKTKNKPDKHLHQDWLVLAVKLFKAKHEMVAVRYELAHERERQAARAAKSQKS